MSETYNRKNPGPYIDPLYKRAREWYDSISPNLREQWDMWMAKDEYQEERDRLGYAHLSFPQIFIAYEAILSTVYKILQSEQSLHVFEAVNQRDIAAKIAGERLTSGFSNIRADLGYDNKIMDLVAGTTIFDYAHMKLEPEWIPIEPGMGVLAQDEEFGTEKLYPSFRVMHPGRVIFDGSYESDEQIPARFEESFVSYQELKRDWPRQVDKWLLKYERSIDDIDFGGREGMSGLSDESIYTFYAKQLGYQGSEKSQRRGFLVVQAELQVVTESGDVERRMVWFLPNVIPENDTSQIHQHGYILGEQGPDYETVRSLYRTCRSRRVPFSNMGRGTSGLLIPFQRHFSAQIAAEMDQDQMFNAPTTIMREGAWVGREDPAISPHEIWTVTDPTNNGLGLDQLVRPLPLSNPNRAYLASMGDRLHNMAEMISAAAEGTTGADTSDSNKTLGAFEQRNQGALGRISIQFMEHALSLIWLGKNSLRMMRETPEQFLYPPHAAYSETLGAEGMLEMQDLSAATRLRVPALSQFAKRELGRVMWAMVGESFQKIPIYAEAPELQLWYIEHMVRAQGVPEADVQEAMLAARQGVMQAAMQASYGAIPPEMGGGQPTPGVQPGQLMNAGNMRGELAAV